jgi:hypothetical protein
MSNKMISKNILKHKIAVEHVAANPNLTIKELCDIVKVDRKTMAKWTNSPEFIDATYSRFMQIAGKELPLLLMALLREGKEGNVRAIELALKHWGKLQDTLVVKVEAPFMQHLKSKNGEITQADVIDVADETTDEDFSELPPRNILNDQPVKRVRDANKDIKRAIKRDKAKSNRNKRYNLRNRALKVGLEPLPPGRPDPAKRRAWLKKLRVLEKKLIKK